jgi:hypothetical protein
MDKYEKMKDHVRSVISDSRRNKFKPKGADSVVTVIKSMKPEHAGFEGGGDDLDEDLMEVLKSLRK